MRKRVPIWPVLLIALFIIVPGFSGISPQSPDTDGMAPATTHAGTSFPGGRASSRAAGEPERPDIVLANLSWSPDGSYDGVVCTLLATVFNDGLSTASAFTVELYADGAAVGSPVVNGLTGGGTTTVKASWTASAGSHELRALADPGYLVSESNETNNFKLAYVEVPFPDLVIANVSWYPQDFQTGEKVTVAATVSNTGNGGTTRQFVVESFMDQTRQTNRIIGGLGPGGSSLATFQWTATSGNHTLFMNVDPGDAVQESNEMNNRFIAHVGQDFPDILPTDLRVVPEEPVDGGTAVLTASVTNAGKGGANRQFRVGFIIDGETVGSAGVWGLAPNASAPVSFNWKATPGHHDIRVDADYASEVDESVEGNNYLVRSFDVPWPELVLEDLRWEPAVPTDGRPVNFNFSVLNRGNGSTARRFEVALMVDGVQISTSDVLGLQKGQQKNISAVWTASPGSHELRAMADSSRAVSEMNETDNAAVDTLDVPYPDIVVAGFDYAPRISEPGTPVTIKASIRNAGPGNTSRFFEVKFFAGGNEAGAIRIEGLSTGLSRNMSVNWTAVPGTWELAVVADAGSTIQELSELNNYASASIDIPYPDIAVVGMLWTPGNFTAGQPINVSAGLRNIGPANQTGTLLVYLFSGSELVASGQVPGLLAGENRSVDLSFFPTAAPATLKVEADPQGTIHELSETNNGLSLFFPNRTVVVQPMPPDMTISGLRSFPERPADGDKVSVVANIKGFNLSSDPVAEIEMHLLVDARQAASQRTVLLAEEGLVTFEWTAVPGTHLLQVVADPSNNHPEKREDNNMASLNMTVLLADLTIAGLTPTWPDPMDGEGASVSCVLVNVGQGHTRREMVTSLYVDGELVRTIIQSGLLAGQNNTLVFSFSAAPGTHRLNALANSGGSVLEASVLNNWAYSRMDVALPNIVVASIDAADAADEGAPVTVTAAVANTGGSTTREIQVAIFIDALQIGRMRVSSILGGRSATVSASWTAKPGTHLVTVTADIAGAAGESDDSDNWLSVRGIDVASSDIQVMELNLEGPPVSGAVRLVHALIRNAGAATSSEMEIGFSIDESLQRTVKLHGLPANSSYVVTQLLPLGPGIHTVKASADVLDAVSELDETNNDAVLDTGSPGAPDVTLAALRVPETALDGEEVHIFAEVENSGQADFMGRFYVAMFVDGILIADIPVEGLAAGGATTVAARWTASPGAHLFRAVADVGNTVDENNETDNEIHRTGASVEQPDLRVRDVMAVKGPGQEGNDAFTVFAVLENIGGATLRPITVEALADASVLGDTQLGGLPARTATQVSLPVHSLNPQWLTVVADPDATIQEHDEYDNAASADFSPLLEVAGARPDLTVSEISVPMTGLTDGQPTAVFVTIDNTGNATLMGGVDVRLSTTDGFDSQTTLYGLLAGESAVMGFPWTASGGTTAFDASVNTGRVQPEWSFEDNQLGRKISTMLPDYKISSLVRWNSTEGLEAPIFAVVENAGTGDTVRSTTLDVFIGGVLHLQQGFNGLCSGGQMTIPIRWAAVSGARDIRLEVDRQRQTPESDEGNNMLLDEIYTEYPDLSVTNISWAPHPDNVSLLTVYAEVQNTGTGSTARPLQVSHDTDSYGLDSVTIYGLPANSSTVITWKWALLAGEHVFTVDADVSDAVHESDENNNRLVVEYPSGRARPPPQSLNILIDNVTYRQSANKTGNITQNILTVVLSVHNNGQQDLPASFAAFFADSLLVVEIAVPPLAVNSTAVFAYPWNATVSNHTVKVMVDYRHQFPEDVETDNELSVFIEENNPPTVDAGGNRSVLVGQPVTFKGYGNDPIDGYIALYEWDFNGDGTYDYNSTVSPTVTHVYYSNGTYIVRLRVTDDRGATSVSSAILVVKLKDEKPFLRADELTFAAIILAISVLAAAAVLIYRKRDEQ